MKTCLNKRVIIFIMSLFIDFYCLLRLTLIYFFFLAGIYIMTVQVDDHALFLSFFDFMYEPNKLNKQVQCITLTTMQTR